MSIQGDDNDNRFEIHEMFMAEAGDKCFYGTLTRNKDANGQPHLFSRITVNPVIFSKTKKYRAIAKTF